MAKIWANSGDSHLVEPADLFTSRLPADLAARMPRSERDTDGRWETVLVDGKEFRRRMPGRGLTDPETGLTVDERAPGANDPHLRLADLDQEGIWSELIYPSIGIWTSSIEDAALLKAGTVAINDWAIEFQGVSPRFVCTASIPLLSIPDAVAEAERVAGLGFKAAFLPVTPPDSQPGYQHGDWDPLWAALSATGLVAAFHIGTESRDANGSPGLYHLGPGGALLNYFETTFGGQRAVAALIASGAMDRHPELRVMVSEGGATWGPFLADRLDEGYRQHYSAARPKLSMLPSEYLYSRVYASFQHDRSAVTAATAMAWTNVCWGSDYPHIEGTYGHSQKTLHELLDDVAPAAQRRIAVGAFQELFPHIPDAPTE
jgi:predicted TIM-barrel fold metal-dependent hydrolase